METSTDDQQQSFRSPPRRRRSTFFERRDSIVPQQTEPKAQKHSENCEEHNEHMNRYYNQLLSEKEQWKKEVKERRSRYHDLKQQYELATKSTTKSRVSYSSLSQDDIEFLKGKPNIAKLSESQVNLHRSVMEARTLFSRANDLDNVLLSHCEERIKKITQYIMDNSTVEPVE